MKALVLKEYNHFVYEDVPVPEYGPDEVLIRVKACGICGSDMHGMDGSTGRRVPPIIMGHEASGIITETGANVRDFVKGDRVTFDSTIYCGKCFFCRRDLINLCDNRRVLGVSCDEYSKNGAFAEFVAVPEHILYRLPETLTFERAAMVEPLSIAFHAVERALVSLNDSAVVIGTGIIGLFVIQLLRLKGCGKIAAVDLDPDRLALAGGFGADECLIPEKKNVPDEIYRITGNRGADVAFEAVGVNETVRMAVDSLRKGGTLALIGNVSPAVDLPLQKVVARELSLLGSCASCGEYPACLDKIARGAVNVDKLLSAAVPLSEGASWFRRLYEREPGLMKVILMP